MAKNRSMRTNSSALFRHNGQRANMASTQAQTGETDTALGSDIIERLRFAMPEVEGQSRSIETRRKIIKAAAECFAHEGFDNSSTHDIAAIAGTNQGLITYHFKSKDGLWRMAADQLFGELRNELATRLYELREVDEPIFFKLIIRHFLRWMAKNPNVLPLMMQENRADSERLKWLIERHIQPIHEVWRHFMEVGQRRNIIRDLPVGHLILFMLSGSLPFSLAAEIRQMQGIDSRSPEFVEAHANALIDLFFVDGN